MKNYIPVLIVAAAVATLCACGAKNSAEKEIADSTAIVDAMPAEEAVAEEENNGPLPDVQTTTVSATRTSRYADVKMSVEVPAVASEVEKKMLVQLWDVIDKSVSASYDGESRIMPKYKGDVSDSKKAVNYYASKIFNAIEKECKQDRAEMGADDTNDEDIMKFERDITVKKQADLDHHVVFIISWYGYSGGAHGGTVNTFVTFNKNTGDQVEKVLPKSAGSSLQREMRDGLCKFFECKEKDLYDNLLIETKTIPMPQQPPYLTKDGVEFSYQQYEIAPYSSGMPTFTIPYSKLKDLLLVIP